MKTKDNIEDNYDICRVCKKFLPKKEMQKIKVYTNGKWVDDSEYWVCDKCIENLRITGSYEKS